MKLQAIKQAYAKICTVQSQYRDSGACNDGTDWVKSYAISEAFNRGIQFKALSADGWDLFIVDPKSHKISRKAAVSLNVATLKLIRKILNTKLRDRDELRKYLESIIWRTSINL